MLQPEDKLSMYREAMRMFAQLDDYKDSKECKKECKNNLPQARAEYREAVYQSGMQLIEHAKSAVDYEAAIAEFRQLKREYKDIPQQIEKCERLKEKELKNERARSICHKLLTLAVVAAVIAFIFYLRTPQAYYQEGKLLMSLGDYERANTVFAKSKDYKDTKDHVLECSYQRAISYAKEGDYQKAVRLLYDKVGNYKDAGRKKTWYERQVLAEAQIGDTVIFGMAKWIVAERMQDQLLLIKKSPIEAQTVYQESGKPFSWAASQLRAWLNNEFYRSCFSKSEQKMLQKKSVQTNANSVYGTNGGYGTNDAVFLLDETQAEQYRELLLVQDNQKDWWLRTPGKAQDSAAFVSPEGTVMHYGYTADSKEIGVRPAVWVSIQEQGDNRVKFE